MRVRKMDLKLSWRRCGWLLWGENGWWVQRIKGRWSVVFRFEGLLEIKCQQSSRKQRKPPFRPAFSQMYPFLIQPHPPQLFPMCNWHPDLQTTYLSFPQLIMLFLPCTLFYSPWNAHNCLFKTTQLSSDTSYWKHVHSLLPSHPPTTNIPLAPLCYYWYFCCCNCLIVSPICY